MRYIGIVILKRTYHPEDGLTQVEAYARVSTKIKREIGSGFHSKHETITVGTSEPLPIHLLAETQTQQMSDLAEKLFDIGFDEEQVKAAMENINLVG